MAPKKGNPMIAKIPAASARSAALRLIAR